MVANKKTQPRQGAGEQSACAPPKRKGGREARLMTTDEVASLMAVPFDRLVGWLEHNPNAYPAVYVGGHHLWSAEEVTKLVRLRRESGCRPEPVQAESVPDPQRRRRRREARGGPGSGYVTVGAFCAALGISKSTAWAWMDRGLVEWMQVLPRSPRKIPRAELERLIQAGTRRRRPRLVRARGA